MNTFTTVRTLTTLAQAKGISYAGLINSKAIDRIRSLPSIDRRVKAMMIRQRRMAWLDFCDTLEGGAL
jgi:hypothetical protein